MGSNEKKSATLGMPHGTAAHRLRKMLLFDLLKRHKENVCFRCDEEIDSVDVLSIEHKKPWEGVSSALFWDLSNIAFSHLRCNVPHIRRGGVGRRKVGPEGTAWCYAHGCFEPRKNFAPNKYKWTGLQSYCRETRPDR